MMIAPNSYEPLEDLAQGQRREAVVKDQRNKGEKEYPDDRRVRYHRYFLVRDVEYEGQKKDGRVRDVPFHEKGRRTVA